MVSDIEDSFFEESIEFWCQVLGISFVAKKVYFCDKITAYFIRKTLIIKYLKDYQNARGR